MKIGDVLYVKGGFYGKEWDGWPMVLEIVDKDETMKFRYQLRDSGKHNYIYYSMKEISEHLEER